MIIIDIMNMINHIIAIISNVLCMVIVIITIIVIIVIISSSASAAPAGAPPHGARGIRVALKSPPCCNILSRGSMSIFVPIFELGDRSEDRPSEDLARFGWGGRKKKNWASSFSLPRSSLDAVVAYSR